MQRVIENQSQTNSLKGVVYQGMKKHETCWLFSYLTVVFVSRNAVIDSEVVCAMPSLFFSSARRKLVLSHTPLTFLRFPVGPWQEVYIQTDSSFVIFHGCVSLLTHCVLWLVEGVDDWWIDGRTITKGSLNGERQRARGVCVHACVWSS